MELPKSDHELKALCASCLAPECLGRDKHKMNASVCGWHQPVTLAHIAPLESMRSRLCAALGLPADSTPETVAEALNHTALVGRGELSILRDFAARRMGPRESDRLEMTQDGYAETLRAIRANQRGSEHGNG